MPINYIVGLLPTFAIGAYWVQERIIRARAEAEKHKQGFHTTDEKTQKLLDELAKTEERPLHA